MAGALEVAGYGGRPAIQQYLSFLDLPGVVEQITDSSTERLCRGDLDAVEFVIRNPRAWHPKRFDVGLRSDREFTRSIGLGFLSARASRALVGVMVGC